MISPDDDIIDREFLSVDPAFLVSAGAFRGYSTVVKFGHNADVDTTEEDLWSEGGNLTYLTTASTIRIQAGGNAADTAAGTGAREVHIQGLDANYNLITDTLVTNGASASTATTKTYLRVLRAYVGEVGSSGHNVGAITIEAVTGGTTQAHIPAELGQTQQCFYTVPAGKTAYVIGETFSCVKGAGGGAGSGTAGIHFHGWVRVYNEDSTNNYESWRSVFDILVIEAGNNPAKIKEDLYEPIPEKSDIRVSAVSDTSNMEVNGRLFILLRDN